MIGSKTIRYDGGFESATGLPQDALKYVLEMGSLPNLRLDSRVNLQVISSHLRSRIKLDILRHCSFERYLILFNAPPLCT